MRRLTLFNTPSMVSAIYLDPRIKFKLNSTQRESAILHTKKLYNRREQDKFQPSVTSSELNSTLDELNDAANQESEVDSGHLMMSLTYYETVKHLDFKFAVMDFWKIKRWDFHCYIHWHV